MSNAHHMTMSNAHLLKDARKAGTGRTDQDMTFKKPFQTVRRPITLDHNMHDDFVRNPPKNKSLPRPSLRWAVRNEHTNPGSASDLVGLGRIKHADIESALVKESSVHS